MKTFSRILQLLVLALVVLAGADARAACEEVQGDYQASDVVCQQSPLLLCSSGTFSGDMQASYTGAFQALVPAPTLAQPLRVAYTSADELVTDTETLTGDTSGHIVVHDTVTALVCVIGCAADAQCLGECLLTYASTSFSSTTVLHDGRGGFDAAGTGSYLDGVSRGTYDGEICGP